MALFPLPAAAFHVLKGRLHTHTPAILAHPLATSRAIGNQEPGLLLSRLPDGTQLEFQGVFLPQTHGPIPGGAFMRHEVAGRSPALPGAMPPRLAELLLLDAQDIVPALGLTQLDERQSTQPTISDQRTVGFPQRLLDSRKQRAHNLPEPLVPFLLAWHHFPG